MSQVVPSWELGRTWDQPSAVDTWKSRAADHSVGTIHHTSRPAVLIIRNGGAKDGWDNRLMLPKIVKIDHADSPERIRQCLRRSVYSIIVLIGRMFDVEEYSAIRASTDRHEWPHVVVCLNAGGPGARISALELGADECFTASCCPEELSAKIRAILRRRHDLERHGAPTKDRDQDHRTFSLSGWSYRCGANYIISPSGNSIPLTMTERDILANLLRDPHVIRSRYELLGLNEPSLANLRSVDVAISRLRRKMADHGGKGIIKTVHGKGYALRH